jgi:hypothetical protein
MVGMINECGAVCGMRMGRRKGRTRREPASVPLCPPSIPHELTWNRTWAAALGNWRLTAWAMARPCTACNTRNTDYVYNSIPYEKTSALLSWSVEHCENAFVGTLSHIIALRTRYNVSSIPVVYNWWDASSCLNLTVVMADLRFRKWDLTLMIAFILIWSEILLLLYRQYRL